jgi:hypothetical protein
VKTALIVNTAVARALSDVVAEVDDVPTMLLERSRRLLFLLQ